MPAPPGHAPRYRAAARQSGPRRSSPAGGLALASQGDNLLPAVAAAQPAGCAIHPWAARRIAVSLDRRAEVIAKVARLTVTQVAEIARAPTVRGDLVRAPLPMAVYIGTSGARTALARAPQDICLKRLGLAAAVRRPHARRASSR